MRTRVGALLLVVCVGGCGGSSADAAGTALSAALCDLAFRCCSTGEVHYYLGPYTDAGNCRDRLLNSASIAPGVVLGLSPLGSASVALPNLAFLDRAVHEGRVSVRQDGLDACIAYLGNLACNQPPPPPMPSMECAPPPSPMPSPCELDLLFEGHGEESDPCSAPGVALECQAGLVCRAVIPMGLDGVCVRLGGVGDFCFDDAECRNDLYCSQLDGTCQPPRKEGETCVFADRDDPSPPASSLLVECEPTLSCDPVTDTCVAPCQRGAACFGDDDCDEDANLVCILGRCDLLRPLGLPCGADDDCDPTLRCETDPADPSIEVCSPKLAAGQVCFAHDDCTTGYCDAPSGVCAGKVAPGGLCPSRSDAQCDMAYCATTAIPCTMNAECLGSGMCDAMAGTCRPYCVALLPDGAMCNATAECMSGACIGGFCWTVPLADGQPCNGNSQCMSGFCSLDSDRVCATLPLPNGSVCNDDDQCQSHVCHSGSCVEGLAEGQACNGLGQPPCGAGLFCDVSGMRSICAPLHQPGQECDSSLQCQGSCVSRFGRMICDATPAAGAAICDGP